MVDHSQMRLGKRAPVFHPGLRDFALYAPALPAPKPTDWLGGQTDWGMFLNDQEGDCTIASKIHGLQVVAKQAGFPFAPTDNDAQHYYEVIDGYNPADPSTDQGGVISDVLAYIAKNGFCGQKLAGACRVDPQNDLHVDLAIALFADLDVGVQLPISAQTQDVWDVPEGQALTGDFEPGSWGGHDISVHAFDADGNLTCITWGGPKKLTRRWLKAYCDEAYGLLWAAWIKGDGKSPSGFDLKALLADTRGLGDSVAV